MHWNLILVGASGWPLDVERLILCQCVLFYPSASTHTNFNTLLISRPCQPLSCFSCLLHRDKCIRLNVNIVTTREKSWGWVSENQKRIQCCSAIFITRKMEDKEGWGSQGQERIMRFWVPSQFSSFPKEPVLLSRALRLFDINTPVNLLDIWQTHVIPTQITIASPNKLLVRALEVSRIHKTPVTWKTHHGRLHVTEAASCLPQSHQAVHLLISCNQH